MNSTEQKKPYPRAKKRLGQNFLLDANVLKNMILKLDLQASDTVLEIGPGTGSLTELIQPVVATLIAIEIDRQLALLLRHKFAGCENFQLIEGDFLKSDFTKFVPDGKMVRVVGNIPYYITSDIIFHVFDNCKGVLDMTLLMQKEVADRIIASPHTKEYGILSVFSQTLADTAILLRVPATVFYPRPKVDSALVRWRFTDERSQHLRDKIVFRKLVRTAFGQRRKMLRKSLRESYPLEALSSIDLTRRPEDLSIDEWIHLANMICDLKN